MLIKKDMGDLNGAKGIFNGFILSIVVVIIIALIVFL